jgi:two-component system response regulator PilR (NtrC family)
MSIAEGRGGGNLLLQELMSEPGLQKILVIDDEVDLVETYARLLEHLGYSCQKAYDRPQAIELIDAAEPALVLTDLRLPSGDGFEIVKYVRTKWPDTPIIVMTAYHNDETAEAANAAGAFAYLRKPFSNTELAQAIHRALAASHAS